VFKIHVIHIIDDLKFNYVLHHAFIVHEALITLSHFNYESLFHNESNLLPTSSFDNLSYPIPTIHHMPILVSHLVEFSILNSLRATDRTFLLSPFTLNNHEERRQRWMLLLDKTRKKGPKNLQLPAFQIIARFSAHVQSYKRRIYTWCQFFEIVN
jgi:hypothetical protein